MHSNSLQLLAFLVAESIRELSSCPLWRHGCSTRRNPDRLVFGIRMAHVLARVLAQLLAETETYESACLTMSAGCQGKTTENGGRGMSAGVRAYVSATCRNMQPCTRAACLGMSARCPRRVRAVSSQGPRGSAGSATETWGLLLVTKESRCFRVRTLTNMAYFFSLRVNFLRLSEREPSQDNKTWKYNPDFLSAVVKTYDQLNSSSSSFVTSHLSFQF